jgi:CubicO group peptidase (beta-lactamase class C family)
VRHLKPAYSLRAGFVYQNVMYGAAGEVIARASGMRWEDFLRTRLFVPLGMTRTYPTYRAMAAARDANTSRAHYRVRDTVRVIDEDTVDAVPAAGSVWSTASDMARWTRFLLDSARVNGTRLISARSFAELFRPQVMVPPGEFYPTAERTRPRWTSYGLGWFQQDYNGRYIAFHTGSLDGRTAIVAVVPDARMSVIVLGNLDHAEVRHALMLRAIDTFAGTNGAPARDWSAELLALYGGQRRRADSARAVIEVRRVAGTRPTLALGAYAGTYVHPAWGALVVTERGGSLHLRAGGGVQNAGPLQHWHYDTFRVSFGDGRGRPSVVQFALAPDGTVHHLVLDGSDEYTFTRAAAPTTVSASP